MPDSLLPARPLAALSLLGAALLGACRSEPARGGFSVAFESAGQARPPATEPVLAPPSGLNGSSALNSLREALARANPSLEGARARLEAARAAALAQQRNLWPELALSIDYLRTDRPSQAFALALDQRGLDFSAPLPSDLGRIGNLHRELRLDWSLFDPTRGALSRAAEAGAAGRAAEASTVMCALTNELTVAWLSWRGSLALERTAAASIAVAEQRLARTLERQRAGAALESDRLRAQLRLAQAGQARVEAQAQVQLARARLGELIGGQAPSSLEPAPAALEPSAWADGLPAAPAWPVDPAEGVALAREQRDELRASDRQLEAARAQTRASERAWLPGLGLRAAYAFDGEDPGFDTELDSSWIGLGFNWRLSGSTAPRASEARAHLRESEAQQAELLARLKREVESAYIEERSARQGLELSAAALDAAREAARLISAAFERGAATLTDTLEAEDQLRVAESARVRAELRLEIAITRLIDALGGTR